jgi:hypothetical protein
MRTIAAVIASLILVAPAAAQQSPADLGARLL